MRNDPPRSPTKPTLAWTGQGKRRRCRVTTEHSEGPMLRGTIRPVDLADTTGPGLAGRTVWALSDYDAHDLGTVTCDFTDALKALLDATKELED